MSYICIIVLLIILIGIYRKIHLVYEMNKNNKEHFEKVINKKIDKPSVHRQSMVPYYIKETHALVYGIGKEHTTIHSYNELAFNLLYEIQVQELLIKNSTKKIKTLMYYLDEVKKSNNYIFCDLIYKDHKESIPFPINIRGKKHKGIRPIIKYNIPLEDIQKWYNICESAANKLD